MLLPAGGQMLGEIGRVSSDTADEMGRAATLEA
jgi:hypothetical protein